MGRAEACAAAVPGAARARRQLPQQQQGLGMLMLLFACSWFCGVVHSLSTLHAPCPPNTFLVHWRHGKAGGHDWFSSDMRQQEFLSICETQGLPTDRVTFHNALPGDGEASQALQYITGLPSADAAAAVAARSVCVRALHSIWLRGADLEAAGAAAAALPATDARVARLGHGSWRARVRRFEGDGAKYGRAMRSPPHRQEHAALTPFAPLLARLPGPVRLQAPDHTLFVMTGAFVEPPPDAAAAACAQQQEETQSPVAAEQDALQEPQSVLLTHQLSAGYDCGPYAVRLRAFASTTTMDAEVGFVMARHAKIAPGDAVLDPFAGSGGLLLTAAVLGAAVTVGVEIDKRLRYRHLNANFEQARLPALTALVHGDMATPAARAAALAAGGGRPFDAVLTDPPYGKRANTAAAAVPAAAALDALTALLELCAAPGVLRVGGRLVCFAPTTADCASIAEHLPRHRALRLVAAAEQPLTSTLARWLLTYDKVRDARPGEALLPPLNVAAGGGGGSGGGGSVAGVGRLGYHQRTAVEVEVEGGAEGRREAPSPVATG